MYINNNSNNRIAQSELFGEWGNDNDNDDDNDDGDWKKNQKLVSWMKTVSWHRKKKQSKIEW